MFDAKFNQLIRITEGNSERISRSGFTNKKARNTIKEVVKLTWIFL